MTKKKIFRVLEKYYSKHDNMFHIIKCDESLVRKPTIDFAFDSFNAFYKDLNGDLSDADLLNYDFDDIDLSAYDLTNAKISSKTMQKLGMYDDALYKKIMQFSDVDDEMQYEVDVIKNGSIVEIDELPNDDDAVILYISDLHICHKLINRFGSCLMANEYEIRAYLQEIIQDLTSSVLKNHYQKAIIIGDVSSDFDIFKMFFEEYKKVCNIDTFFVLGNHELWIADCKTLDEIVEKYRVFLSSVGVTLLENELFFPRCDKNVWNSEDILSATKEELREVWTHNPYAIFGGIGYAGRNDKYNSSFGIYRNPIIDRNTEIFRSKIVEMLHDKLADTCGDKKIVFATHMPKEDWASSNYVQNWVYLSGHTHHNYCCVDEEKNVLADNQIGYKGNSFGFKYFWLTNKWDVFCDYSDGVYELTREQYYAFNQGIWNYLMRFNRSFYKLYMLKKNGYYLFLLKQTKDSPLRLLKGGSILDVGEYDIDYFYNQLDKYGTAIKHFLSKYIEYQKEVSNRIKMIGGSGKIHGCIVDIDYYNHIYVNPHDFSLTSYYATSITSKWVYGSLMDLLEDYRSDLVVNYRGLVDSGKWLVKKQSSELAQVKRKKLVKSTQIYQASRIVKSLQYTTEFNVVRSWNDIMLANDTEEGGRGIIEGIIKIESKKEDNK